MLTWPASVFQYTLMAIDLLFPGGSAGPHVTMSVAARISGPVDVDLLDRAYDALIARNDVLRSTVVAEGAEWVQKVHPHRTVHLERVDGGGAAPEKLVGVWADTAVPVDSPPLVRGHVARLDDGDHLLGLTFHHLHTDPRSLNLAVTEMGMLYTALLTGREIPPPALQFGAYVEQRRERMAGRLGVDVAFWRTVIDGAEPMVFTDPLKRDWSRPPSNGSILLPVLSAAGVTALEHWARRHRTSFLAALFSGFCLSMADRVSSRDILATAVFEQRDLPETRDLIGPFLHPALVRVVVPEGAGWDVLTPRVRDAVLAAYERAHVPAVDVLGMQPDLLHSIATEPAGVCVFQYIPHIPAHASGDPIVFGAAGAHLLPGNEVIGPSGNAVPCDEFVFGLMFRLIQTSEGDLVAHVTFDERDLNEDLVRDLCDDFARHLAEPVTATIRGNAGQY